MITFNRPPFAIRGLMLQLAHDGFAVEVVDGKAVTNAPRSKLDEYVQAGVCPAEFVKGKET